MTTGSASFVKNTTAAIRVPKPNNAVAARTTASLGASSDRIVKARDDSESRDSRRAVGASGPPGAKKASCGPETIFSYDEGAAVGVSKARQVTPVLGTTSGTDGAKNISSGTAVATAVDADAAADAAATEAAMGDGKTRIVYIVPEQTPPAVRLVLGRRPGWTEWDPEVHGVNEVRRIIRETTKAPVTSAALRGITPYKCTCKYTESTHGFDSRAQTKT